MSTLNPVEEWLSTCSRTTFLGYRRYFSLFEDFMKKGGAEMLAEARQFALHEETRDAYALNLFKFYKFLEGGAVKLYDDSKFVQARKVQTKSLSQNTIHTAIASVQSFFAFHNVSLNLRKFKKRAPKLQRPQPEKRKRLLVATEIEKLFRIADAKEKALLALGCMGQDATTITSLRVEQFMGKLGASQLEFIDVNRRKTNEPIKILLTPEVQNILIDYITTLRRHEGWLFEGYKNQHLKAQEHNDSFKRLCDKIGIVDNGKRLSSHCLRMWFSVNLRNQISDDIIDLLTGHAVRFGGAYLSDDEPKLRELLTEAKVEDLLRLQSATTNGLAKEVQNQKQTIERLSRMVDSYQKQVIELYREAHPDTKSKVRDVTPYEPKSETELLRAELAELKAEIEKMKKKD